MASDVKPDLRTARRAETEARLVAAATGLFVRQGYAVTTLAQVAERAGVAERTVYVRFATKAALLQRCLDVAIAGDAEPVAVADREWFQGAMTAPTRRERIAVMARVSAGLMERAGPLLRVAQQAEAVEPAIAAAAQAGREETRRAFDAFWRTMLADGLLPAGCDVDWLVDTAGIVGQAETYLLTTRTTRWDVAGYERWLVTTWSRLADGAGSEGQRT